MLVVNDMTVLGRVGFLRVHVQALTWSRLNNGRPVPGYRHRYRGSLKVLMNSYGPGGNCGHW